MSVLRLIGHYQYDESRPSYARYLLPSINPNNEKPTKLEIVGKLAFVPVKNDTDYLIIQNCAALKTMMLAIKNSDNEPDGIKKQQLMASGIQMAKMILDKELDHHLGSGRTIGINVIGSSIGQNDPIPNFI